MEDSCLLGRPPVDILSGFEGIAPIEESSRFPWDFLIDKVAHHFDGVFLINGPGDSTHCVLIVEALRNPTSSSQIPVFGICLGH